MVTGSSDGQSPSYRCEGALSPPPACLYKRICETPIVQRCLLHRQQPRLRAGTPPVQRGSWTARPRTARWEVRARCGAWCAPPPSLTVSAARGATTWRRNRGRVGMRGMRGAAPRWEPGPRSAAHSLAPLPPLPGRTPDPAQRPGRAGAGRAPRKHSGGEGVAAQNSPVGPSP